MAIDAFNYVLLGRSFLVDALHFQSISASGEGAWPEWGYYSVAILLATTK